jgi:hypothetical protein
MAWRPPLTRRLFNQALFERLLISTDDAVEATPTPWKAAMSGLSEALEAEAQRRSGEVPVVQRRDRERPRPR